MTDRDHLLTYEIGEIGRPHPERPMRNAAVNRCARAWQYAYKKEFRKNESENFARLAARHAFSRAMPPLSSRKNIRDFVACVAYGQLTSVIHPDYARHLLKAAEIAASTLGSSPDSLEESA